jgi:isopentenyl diphosphate isomerase/L-lactate dehydrogenase-like FMN-dependent dehydrogenase
VTATRVEIRQMRTPVWCQVFATDTAAVDGIKRAVDAGCRAACVTVGAEHTARGVRAATVDSRQWRAVQTAASAAGVPVIVKGITSPTAARQAVQHGAHGIVFSNYGRLLGSANSASIVDLPAVVESIGGRVPVLMDGGFRRGTDVLKALALGASAVLVARPVAWGLAAYGAEGVQSVVEMLQTELARYMAMCGKPNLQAIERAMVKIHAH